jgi:ketosteroid isomerase-like protein
MAAVESYEPPRPEIKYGAPTTRRRFLMVWGREPDGQWRFARELLSEDL